jgi:RNA polymerase sigma-70 factor (ECF subfamily)
MAHSFEADQRIVDEIRAGNTRAFAVFVDRYKDRAFSLALGLIGERQEAEEIVQDAFVRAYKGLEGFRGDAAFGTWFYRILHNLCLTRISRRGKKEKMFVGLEEMGEERFSGDQEEEGALELLESEELNAQVAREVASLPEKYKTPILLFYIEEMTYDEIASTLDVPVGTVKTNLFRGRNMLRVRLEERMGKEVRVA